MMNRRQFLATSACTAVAGRGAPGRKPNIVLILADDLSYRDLSVFGQQRYSTPNLDRLAVEGMRFTQAYAGAPECAPSRATLLTGQHTGHCSIRANSSARGQDCLQSTDTTVARVLKKAGYQCGLTGKWGCGLAGTTGVPNRQGFDYSFGYYDQSRAHSYYPEYLDENDRRVELPGNAGFDLQRAYRMNVPQPDAADLNRYDAAGRLMPHGVKDAAKAVYSHGLIEEKALEYVEKNRRDPFFLYFATTLPHGPVIIDDMGEMAGRTDIGDQRAREWAAMVQRLDRFTGQLVARLKALGIDKDTAIFFASDNGYSMSGYMGRGNAEGKWGDDPELRNKGPFRGGKFSLLEGGVRVPMFARWPGRIEAGASEQPVWLVDLMPTFAALAGTTPPAGIDGQNLMPLLGGRPAGFPPGRPFYWEWRGSQALRMGAWRAYKPAGKPTELYLITEDPQMERNMANQYRQVVEQVEAAFRREHRPSEWYWNPGETAAEFKAKQEKAKRLGVFRESELGNRK